MSETLICGFPPEMWQAFTSPIDPAMMKKDPNGASYVKHQVCTDALTRCFGYDGWTLRVLKVWEHEPYTYKVTIKENGSSRVIDKEGRYFCEVLVRLTIGKPGYPRTYRENIGAQVAGGSWEEAKKGAVSEGLKRAASLFGWAPNIYQTEQLGEEWLGETIMREMRLAEVAGFELPDNQEAALLKWARDVNLPEELTAKTLALVTSRDSAWAVASVLKHLSEAYAKGEHGATLPAAEPQLAL